MCTVPVYDAVIAIEPVTEEMRESCGLSADAVLALVEHAGGQSTVLSTDDQCPFGISRAARAWAEATGAAYAGVAS